MALCYNLVCLIQWWNYLGIVCLNSYCSTAWNRSCDFCCCCLGLPLVCWIQHYDSICHCNFRINGNGVEDTFFQFNVDLFLNTCNNHPALLYLHILKNCYHCWYVKLFSIFVCVFFFACVLCSHSSHVTIFMFLSLWQHTNYTSIIYIQIIFKNKINWKGKKMCIYRTSVVSTAQFTCIAVM